MQLPSSEIKLNSKLLQKSIIITNVKRHRNLYRWPERLSVYSTTAFAEKKINATRLHRLFSLLSMQISSTLKLSFKKKNTETYAWMAYTYPCGSSRPANSITITMFSWKVRENPAKMNVSHTTDRENLLASMSVCFDEISDSVLQKRLENTLSQSRVLISVTLTSSNKKKKTKTLKLQLIITVLTRTVHRQWPHVLI